MKKITALLFLLVTSNALASVMYIERGSFNCSDDKTYDIARRYVDAWGPVTWELVALCSQGTLKQAEYSGRYLDPKDAHEDVKKCIEEDTAAIRACYDEFVKLNSKGGPAKDGKLPPVIHGKKDKSEKSSTGGESEAEPTDSGTSFQ